MFTKELTKDMTNYQAMKEELNKNKKALEIANKKSNEFDKTTDILKIYQ